MKILKALGWKLYLELHKVEYRDHYYSISFFFGDLFFIISNIDIASYPDDKIPYIAADNIDDLIKLLEEESTVLLQCFDNN